MLKTPKQFSNNKIKYFGLKSAKKGLKSAKNAKKVLALRPIIKNIFTKKCQQNSKKFFLQKGQK